MFNFAIDFYLVEITLFFLHTSFMHRNQKLYFINIFFKDQLEEVHLRINIFFYSLFESNKACEVRVENQTLYNNSFVFIIIIIIIIFYAHM